MFHYSVHVSHLKNTKNYHTNKPLISCFKFETLTTQYENAEQRGYCNAK